ncbi:MAG: protein-glutamate O-methyltransferase CheR [Actinobacteria bacterium]|jgi:chemotaxis protein methyltransferase CheR|nr:protein-glutamate O-methyltransferase CheR [Actinomycetota bacterium]MCL6094594.1 protein-glutamate O-methyltransferase CheR [Actinomycetota bacterium]
MTLAPKDVSYVRELVFDRSAIVLGEDKQYLVESRITMLARDLGLGSAEEVIARLKRDGDRTLEERVIEAMTTNETSWFRDVHPFNALKSVIIPEAMERNAAKRSLAIWSAACSTGQELYSVAMMLDSDFPELSSWKLDLVGTDISRKAVEKAQSGLFTGLEINRGLPATMLVRYFVRDGSGYRIRDDIRNKVRFGVLNLIEPWPPMPLFDVILLRNVLIYFDMDTRRRILGLAKQQLVQGGVLILGGAESVLSLVDGFVPVTIGTTTVYHKDKENV